MTPSRCGGVLSCGTETAGVGAVTARAALEAHNVMKTVIATR
jgi:hypothetical protein